MEFELENTKDDNDGDTGNSGTNITYINTQRYFGVRE